MTGSTLCAISVALLASVVLAPMPAHAQRGGGMGRGGGGGVAGQPAGGGTFVQGQPAGGGAFVAGPGMAGGTFVAGRGPGGRPFIVTQPGARGFVKGVDGFHRHPFFNRGFFFHRGFNSFGTVVVVGGPWGYWPSYSDASMYDPPPAYAMPYAPSTDNTLSLSPPYPPMPSVVEFPTGRYELRGDGRTEQYHWVWIPKPPTAPPAEPSSPAPPAPVSPPSDPGPTRHTPVYRWTDEQGTVHLTDQVNAVPDRYRPKAKRGEPS